MNFFDTQAGYDFSMHTVPKLIDAMKNLTEELKKTNNPTISVLAKASEAENLKEMVLSYAQKNLKNPIFLKNLKSLWTAYCLIKDYQVDTCSYDNELAYVWSVVENNESNPFTTYDSFDNYMCEDLV